MTLSRLRDEAADAADLSTRRPGYEKTGCPLDHHPVEVQVGELQRRIRLPGLSTAEAIQAAAGVLVEAGWLRA